MCPSEEHWRGGHTTLRRQTRRDYKDMWQITTRLNDKRFPPGRPESERDHVTNNIQDSGRARTMEGEFEHGRYTDLPDSNRDIPRQDQKNGHGHSAGWRKGCHRGHRFLPTELTTGKGFLETKQTSVSGGTRWWQKGLPPQQNVIKNEKYREEILERIEEGWQAEEWATSIPQIVNELLLRNLFQTRTPQVTWKI